MIDVLHPKPLANAICAWREAQRHLDCLARQIAAYAGRQAITVRVQSQARRGFGPRPYRHELADRLAFERWAELDTHAQRLALQQQIIDEHELCTDAAFLSLAGSLDSRRVQRVAFCRLRVTKGWRAWPCLFPTACN